MKVAYLEFGNFTNFNKIMDNKLTLFENNIIELNKFLNYPKIDIYILTDKNYNYIESIELIKTILIKYDITLKLVNFWDDLKEYHEIDKNCHNNYINIFNTKQYEYNENDNPWGYDPKKNFNPGNLWYRRYLNFYLFKEYNKNNYVEYDLICLTRLFSTKIIFIKEIYDLDKEFLYYSLDTLFIGNYKNIKKILNFGKYSLFFNNNNNNNNKPVLIENEEFIKLSLLHDSFIGGHIFSSEIQILYYIYTNFIKFKNIRFDYTLYCDNNHIRSLLYTDKHDNSELLKLTFNTENSNLFIVISR